MKNPSLRPVSRRSALKNLGILSLGGLMGSSISSCNLFSSSNGGKIPTLTSGYIPILDSVPVIVAYAKGFFEEYNVAASKPTLIRSWPALMEAFVSKQILLTHILLPQVIFLKYAQEVNLKSIAFNHTNVVAMLVAKELNGIEDLGGQIVGCPTWWAPHTGIFQDVLRKAGLKPVVGKTKDELAPDEVGFRVVAPPDMAESLKSKAIAGCTVSEPFGAASEVLAEAKLIKMSGDVWPDHPCCQSVLLEETINIDRDWAQRLTNAIYKAAIWCHQNREELAELLGKDGGGYFPMPVKVVRKALLDQDISKYGPDGTGAIMHTHWDVKRVGFMPYPFPSSFDTTMDLMKRMVVDPSSALPENIRGLSGKQVAESIVDYDLAVNGFNEAKGGEVFGITGSDEYKREETYDVLIKSENEEEQPQ
ncbi:MAG: ABC transporter substrate-binding protein [Bacteroidota bacterium]